MGGEIKLYAEEICPHENVEESFVFEPSENDLDYILKSIINFRPDIIYVYGTGSQTKSKYRNLIKNGINILWYTRIRESFWLDMLSRIIPASYCGLARIENLDQLNLVVNELTEMSSVEVVVASNIDQNNLKDHHNSKQIEEIFMSDKSFFQVIIDKDNFETKNGMLCIIRYGGDCPLKLKKIADNFGEFGYLGYHGK